MAQDYETSQEPSSSQKLNTDTTKIRDGRTDWSDPPSHSSQRELLHTQETVH